MDSSKVYLVQTDTTVGFLSSNDKKLSDIKKRNTSQKTLQTIDSFKTLKQYTRVPNKYKNLVRRSKTTTFVYPNSFGFRVIPESSHHHNFISKFNSLYSTSANKHKEFYNKEFAYNNADIIVFNNKNFIIKNSSRIIKLYKNNASIIR